MPTESLRKGDRVMITESKDGIPKRHYLIPGTVAVVTQDENRITGSVIVHGECSMPEFFHSEFIEQRILKGEYRRIR